MLEWGFRSYQRRMDFPGSQPRCPLLPLSLLERLGMSRTLTILFRREPCLDQDNSVAALEGYELYWPDGRPVEDGLNAFCKHGQRLARSWQTSRGLSRKTNSTCLSSPCRAWKPSSCAFQATACVVSSWSAKAASAEFTLWTALPPTLLLTWTATRMPSSTGSDLIKSPTAKAMDRPRGGRYGIHANRRFE